MKRFFLFIRKLWVVTVMCLCVTGLPAQNVGKYLKDCEIYNEGHKYGILFRGQPMISPTYDEIVPLTDYVFRVKERNTYGLLSVGFTNERDYRGKPSHVIAEEKIKGSKYYIFFFLSEPCIYDRIELMRDGYMMVYKGEKRGVVNKYGSRVIPSKYDEITRKENVFYVRSGDRQGVYSRYGDVIVPCRYTEIDWNGNAYCVRDGNKYGVISKYGDRIVPTKYDKITRKENVFYVTLGDLQGVYNRYGEVIVPSRCSKISWDGNVYWVQQGDRSGIINKYGEVIVPVQYDKVTKIKDTYCVEKGNLYGVYNRYGNRLLSCTYDSIDFLRDGKFLAVKGGKKQLYSRYGTLISDYSDKAVYYSTSDKNSKVK